MTLEILSQRADIWRGGQTPSAVTQTLSSGFSELDNELNNGGWPVGELIEIYSQDGQDGTCTADRHTKNHVTRPNSSQHNAGHLQLLMPALAQLSQQPMHRTNHRRSAKLSDQVSEQTTSQTHTTNRKEPQRRWIAWVAPPYIPYAPALSSQGIDLNSVLLIHPKTESKASLRSNSKRRSNQTYDRESKNQQLKNTLWAAEQALASNTCSAVLMWIHGAKDRDLRRLNLAAQRGNTLGFLFPALSAIHNPSPSSLRVLTRRIFTHASASVDSTSNDSLEVELMKQRGAGANKTLHIGNHDNYLDASLETRLETRLDNYSNSHPNSSAQTIIN